jgi:ABC-type transporter Mla maintaining outer membrane lipid asymmetry ATPase subunit MlaF
MVLFSKVVSNEVDSILDFSVKAGTSAAIVTSREIESEVIVRLLLGFLSPVEGSVSVNGIQPYLLTDKEISGFRRGVGVIYHDGGFISNLNVWENLTLQLSYDSSFKKTEIEERGRKVLETVGYNGSLSVLANRLSIFERRQIAFARTLLTEPLLMVYQSTLDGLSRSEQTHLSSLALAYHEQGGGRTSLLLTSYHDSLGIMHSDLLYNTGGTTQS